MRTTSLLLVLLAGWIAGCRIGTPDGAPGGVEIAAGADSGAVAFELAGPGGAALVVPVYLNGQGPRSFVLDTGATFTCVTRAVADSLGLPQRAGQLGFGAGIQGSGQVSFVAVDSLRLGAASAFDLSACVIDLSQLEKAGLKIDGLLGLNFLKSFRVTLDFETNHVVLQRP